MRLSTFIKAALLSVLLLSSGQVPLGADPLISTGEKDSGRQALKDKEILVHYMPWYASKPFSGEWGWHWTMNHFDPDKKGKEGKRLLASHYRPLLGPYDSNDPDVLECQALLMKFSGVDGVIVDWYGKNDFNDYAAIHRNAVHLVKYLKRAGLNFAVCYEDRTVGQMIKGGALKAEDAVPHGRDTLRWLQANWFNQEAYLKINKKPVMMVFGPMHYSRQQWQGIFDGLDQSPLLFSLPHLSQKAGADGIFGWVPVHAGKKMSTAQWRGYLDGIYKRGKNGEQVIATVFPGFHDIYQEAGLHPSYGFIDDNEGVTFKETLEIASRSESRFIQVATWNDYGEGTMIEPTVSFGYRYLEALQECALQKQGQAFVFTTADLRLPVKLYNLRKRFKEDEQALELLKRVSGLLFSSRCEEAAALLQKVVESNENQGKR